MLEVTVVDSSVAINMNGTAYHFPKAEDAAQFRREYFSLTNVKGVYALVEKYLSKLVQVLRRITRAVVRMARELADADNYWRGIGAATYQQVQRYM